MTYMFNKMKIMFQQKFIDSMYRWEFNSGVWSAVQFLVISHNETELARQLIKESGLSKEECNLCQMDSDFENDKMYKFINNMFNK